jgi:hypothetical protein
MPLSRYGVTSKSLASPFSNPTQSLWPGRASTCVIFGVMDFLPQRFDLKDRFPLEMGVRLLLDECVPRAFKRDLGGNARRRSGQLASAR